MTSKNRHISLSVTYALFALTIACNIAFWSNHRTEKIKWLNVPPVPSLNGALWSSLGDPQLAFRSYALSIQNMGDTGGKVVRLADYNFKALSEWFLLTHKLDPESGIIPFLAGYFFSASQDPSKIGPIIDYLEIASGKGEGQKWRWMAQAVFLARFKLKDNDRALDLAYKLSSFKNPDMPMWAVQMPVNVLNAQGEKQAAYEMIIDLLKTNADTLHPNEVNATIAYLCEQILTEAEAKSEKLCENFQ